MHYRIVVGELGRVFGGGIDEIFHSRIARLAVLYEDLRIELLGIQAESLSQLDTTDERYRRNYFLRRSIATLLEFAESFRLLEECPNFRIIKAEFDAPSRRRWQKAQRFFEKHEPFLRLVRNDIGGHFGSEAARYAITHLNPNNVVGKIELSSDGRKQGVKLHFAGELAATAMFRHLPGKTSKARFLFLLRRVVVGYRHAIWTVNLLVVFHLWKRFGRA